MYLIDNSPTDRLKELKTLYPSVEYVFNNGNIGYGKAHNISLRLSQGKSKYHLIVNPDISFSEDVVEHIFSFMEKNEKIGQLMPKVFYNDGTIQRLCKLLPTPTDLIGRRFLLFLDNIKRKNSLYELSHFGYDKILDTPNLSGCFMFIKTSIFKAVNGFDPQFFMYLEDVDLTRRINQISRTVFYPEVVVVHGFAKGSYASFKLLRYHVASAIKYFNKWGWFVDKERDELNKKVLRQIEGMDN